MQTQNNTKDLKTSTQINDDMPTTVCQQFPVVERTYSTAESGLSIALANIKNVVSNNENDLNKGASIDCNKKRILNAIDKMKKYKVNMVIFPEFCLTGYFWDDPKRKVKETKYNPDGFGECWDYMDKGALDQQSEWLEKVKSKLDDNLKYIILNGIRRNPVNSDKPAGPKNRFLNSTFVVDKDFNAENLVLNEKFRIYGKTFLPGIENAYEISGQDDRLVIEICGCKFGFTTCYDMAFPQLFQEYAFVDQVDAIIEIASWRATRERDYPSMNVRTNHYYGFIWDLLCSARAATNQVWVIACNTVGHQEKGNYEFCGGSGLWAPSGMKLVQASHVKDELVIIHGIDIKDQIYKEHADFYYYEDFNKIFKPIEGKRAFTRLS